MIRFAVIAGLLALTVSIAAAQHQTSAEVTEWAGFPIVAAPGKNPDLRHLPVFHIRDNVRGEDYFIQAESKSLAHGYYLIMKRVHAGKFLRRMKGRVIQNTLDMFDGLKDSEIPTFVDRNALADNGWTDIPFTAPSGPILRPSRFGGIPTLERTELNSTTW